MKMTKKKADNQNAGERLNTVVDDVKSGYKDLEEKTVKAVTDAKDDVVVWAEDGVSKIKESAHDFAENAKETLHKTSESIDKNVKKGLTQYNAKAQEVADKVPGGLGDNVLRYPWVAISVSLLMGIGLGIGLGILLKPNRRA